MFAPTHVGGYDATVLLDEISSKKKALAKFLTRAPLALSKHLWVWPLLGAVVMIVTGFWVRNRLEVTTKAELASRLQTLLNADIAALRLLFSEQQYDAKSFAADIRISEAINELAARPLDTNGTQAVLMSTPQAAALELYLKPLL